jgi:hypothetical protein
MLIDVSLLISKSLYLLGIVRFILRQYLYYMASNVNVLWHLDPLLGNDREISN